MTTKSKSINTSPELLLEKAGGLMGLERKSLFLITVVAASLAIFLLSFVSYPTGLQVAAVSMTGEGSYSLNYSVLVYLFFLLLVFLLVMFLKTKIGFSKNE